MVYKAIWDILFADRNSRLLELQEFCKTLPFDDLEFVMSNTIYFEMLPKGTTKGTALLKLCDILNIDIKNIYMLKYIIVKLSEF